MNPLRNGTCFPVALTPDSLPPCSRARWRRWAVLFILTLLALTSAGQSKTAQAVPKMTDLSVPLGQGWNLISLPLGCCRRTVLATCRSNRLAMTRLR